MVLSVFGQSFIKLFIDNPSALLLKNTEMYLRYNSMFYFTLSLVNTVRFLIQGMGYSILAIMAGVFEMIARGLTGFILVPKFGYIAACMASPLAWIFADVFLITAYKLIMKRLRNQKTGKVELIKVCKCG